MDGQEAGASALPLDDDVNDSQRAPMLIMPPPPAAPPLLTGLENPAKVRNLRDILHYSTQMTEICPQNRESGPMVLTLEEEVSPNGYVPYSPFRSSVRTARLILSKCTAPYYYDCPFVEIQMTDYPSNSYPLIISFLYNIIILILFYYFCSH